ncbi:MAG: hypothetical protein HQK75_17560 [Candidatus Magnetomorum sp.]|nr:hypothetical protein [Candidatus Magnetomorum sp.]
MIIGKDIHPERKIYYIGALIIEILKKVPDTTFDFFDIYQKLNKSEKVTIKLFTLTLDWLFLLGAISRDKGNIKKCF